MSMIQHTLLMIRVFDYFFLPILLPFLILWYVLAYVLAILCTMLVFPSILISQRLYWCCPFIQYIWKSNGALGNYLRIAFEASYCINVLKRLFTLPLRRKLPDFYIVGFPKAGTTTLANHLKRHPAIDSITGLPWHETLSKESHFFNGVFGSRNASSSRLYRSFFPTIFRRWLVEVVLRQPKWLCFDACPVPACLPFTAERIAHMTPNAKIIFMLRDPTAGIFSAEMMIRNLGVPLAWSLMEEARITDPRFMELKDDVRIWNELRNLKMGEPLPVDMPDYFYNHIHSYLQSGKYADRIEPYLQHFPRENWCVVSLMFIDFRELIKNTPETVSQVLEFVGANPDSYDYKALPPGMKTEYKGRRMHPSVKKRLKEYFATSNDRLYSFLGRDFHWGED